MKFYYKFTLILFFSLISRFGSAQTITVTFLGTGGPFPGIDRFGPSTLVEAGGEYFLFDCGRGVSQRLWQKKIQLGKVNNLFLTHLHSDHTVGIADFWLTGWLPANYGRRSVPLHVYGPSGSEQLMESLQSAYAWDITTRSLEKNKTDSGITVVAKDIKEGIIYEKGGIKITAFRVDHADFIDSALGYRLDYKDRSVVISGDTRYSDNLIKYARGTDVLIHEVAAAREELVQKSATARQILGFHTSPEEAGKIFTKVNPRMAVYSHIILLTTDPAITAPSADDLLPRTKTNYKGLLEVGEDLMTIMIGDKIIIERHRNEKR